ncbi:MAG: lipopolysaccharide biosynthesis protein, partial [Chloroflexota bacterium]
GLTAGSAVCAALWFVAPGYLDNHSGTALGWARVILVALPISVGVQTILEMERRRSANASWNRWRSAAQVVPAVAIVALWVGGSLTYNTAMAAYAIGSLSALPLLVARLWRASDRRPSWAALGLMLPYAWRSALSWGATSMTARLDQVVLTVVVPSGDLGLYAVAVTVASVTNLLTTGISLALFGHLRDNPRGQEAVARFRRSMIVAMGLAGAVAIAIATLAPLVLRLGFGSGFEAGAPALRLLLPGAVAFSLLGVLGTKLAAEGRPGEMARAAVASAIFTVVGLLISARRFGIEGAAVVTSLAYVLQVLYLLRRRAARFDEPAGTGGQPSGADRVLSSPSDPVAEN